MQANQGQNTLKIRGRLIASHQLPIQTLDKSLFTTQLTETIEKAPALFKNAPCILDLSSLEEHVNASDLSDLIAICRQSELIPFALTGTKASHENTANELSLAWVNLKTNSSSKSGSKSVKYDTKIITTPIRSGQQIYAKDANLVIMTQVSAGAEIAADGNIHIFGALRGRAIAGAVGNTDAEIICQDMKAELISIAGTYLVQEDFPDGDGSAHCRLANDSILIEYL